MLRVLGLACVGFRVSAVQCLGLWLCRVYGLGCLGFRLEEVQGFRFRMCWV